jgi:hypothetical protein
MHAIWSMRLVLIEWVDSYGCSPQWRELSDCTPELLVCRSVGWLLHDGEDVKVVVPHVIESPESSRIADQGSGDMTIPTSAIRSISDVQVGRSGKPKPTRRAG